ncbi:MAG: hypothetical protein QOJ02_1663 [Acidobacteriota bacterium]|jgi:hypothetical protein|nr:hypothetical protein [Acidobacteriota bacterium]
MLRSKLKLELSTRSFKLTHCSRVCDMRFYTRLLYYCPFQRATAVRQPGIKTREHPVSTDAP